LKFTECNVDMLWTNWNAGQPPNLDPLIATGCSVANGFITDWNWELNTLESAITCDACKLRLQGPYLQPGDLAVNLPFITGRSGIPDPPALRLLTTIFTRYTEGYIHNVAFGCQPTVNGTSASCVRGIWGIRSNLQLISINVNALGPPFLNYVERFAEFTNSIIDARALVGFFHTNVNGAPDVTTDGLIFNQCNFLVTNETTPAAEISSFSFDFANIHGDAVTADDSVGQFIRFRINNTTPLNPQPALSGTGCAVRATNSYLHFGNGNLGSLGTVQNITAGANVGVVGQNPIGGAFDFRSCRVHMESDQDTAGSALIANITGNGFYLENTDLRLVNVTASANAITLYAVVTRVNSHVSGDSFTAASLLGTLGDLWMPAGIGAAPWPGNSTTQRDYVPSAAGAVVLSENCTVTNGSFNS
jgi:hypothetical protein